MRNLCDAAQMSCDVAALPFQAHANYGTWSIDFAITYIIFLNPLRWKNKLKKANNIKGKIS